MKPFSSSWAIWDFFENNLLLNEHKEGICLINCSDAFVEKMILHSSSKKNYEGEKIHPLIGSELSESMIDDKLFSLDFFSSNLSYYVLLADDIRVNDVDYLLKRASEIKNQVLFLFFRRKTSPAWKLFVKNKEINKIEIKHINFWEGQKLFNFLMNYLKSPLPYEISQYLVDVLPLEVSEYIKYIKLIKTNFLKPSDLNLDNVKTIVLENKIDHFLFSESLGKKDFKNFYFLLSRKKLSFEALRGLFVFLQSHLLKLMDISYTEKKNRLSNYDKEIIVHSKLWNKKELINMILDIQKYELSVKQQDIMIYKNLNQKYISYL